ncbi:MAG: alpha/beta hydrolase [bacterium]|nr:alpha/beta hydrolase [bacterium]
MNRAILVGHSDGGSIALVAAALYPERVQSVVAMAAHVFLEEVTLAGVRDTVATAGETRLLERLEKYHGAKSERLYSVWHETWLDLAHREWNLMDFLPHIHCPVLVMQGDLDEYGSVEQVKGIVKGVGEKARAVMYQGVGHAVWREGVGEVVGQILKDMRGRAKAVPLC